MSEALRRFHNALRILTSIDRCDFPGSDDEWMSFVGNPHRHFIRASDEQAQKLWAVIESRQRKRPESMMPEAATDEIIRDMCGRSGGDHWFHNCDEDAQDDIRATWTEIVRQVERKAQS